MYYLVVPGSLRNSFFGMTTTFGRNFKSVIFLYFLSPFQIFSDVIINASQIESVDFIAFVMDSQS